MNFSIRWPIVLGSILLVWGTHLIIAPYSHFNSERVLKQHARDIMQNISDLTLEQSHNHLNKATSAAHLAKQLLSSDMFTKDEEGPGSLERYFFDQLAIYPHLAGIYFGNQDGDFFYVSRNDSKMENGYRTKIINNGPGQRVTELRWREPDYNMLEREFDPADTYDPRERPWYKKVMELNHVAWTSPYIFFTSKKPGVTIAGPAYGPAGNLKGIVGVDIEIDELSEFIGRLRVGKDGKAFILNRNCDVIAYHQLDKLTVPKEGGTGMRLAKINELGDPVIEAAFDAIDWKKGEKGKIEVTEPVYSNFNYGGESYLAMFTPFPGDELSWVIGVYVPEDDYLGGLKANRNVVLVATLVVTILVSWLALIFTGKLIFPIKNLQKEAKAIEENDLKTNFVIHSRFSEINETANSFARMKESLIHFKDRLREKELIHRTITKSANDAIVMIDEQQNITFWNPAAERIFGHLKGDVIGNDLPAYLAPDRYRDEFRAGMKAFMEAGEGPYANGSVELLARHKKGREFTVELSLSRLKIDDSWQAAGIVRDVTERKRSEELRKQLVRDLHDGIGGNLANIKLLSEMIKQGEHNAGSHKALSSISEVSDSCIAEIRNYMNVLDENSPGWKEVISELRQYCGRTLEPHAVDFKLEATVASESQEPSSLVYMNLFKIVREAITNVIKHSEASGVEISVNISEDALRCSIADNGKAIPTTSGSGRGLMSMETRAKELGGTIDFSYSDGMKITLEVPLRKLSSTESDPRGGADP
jgi:PAS domain S-box-containing protein